MWRSMSPSTEPFFFPHPNGSAKTRKGEVRRERKEVLWTLPPRREQFLSLALIAISVQCPRPVRVWTGTSSIHLTRFQMGKSVLLKEVSFPTTFWSEKNSYREVETVVIIVFSPTKSTRKYFSYTEKKRKWYDTLVIFPSLRINILLQIFPLLCKPTGFFKSEITGKWPVGKIFWPLQSLNKNLIGWYLLNIGRIRQKSFPASLETLRGLTKQVYIFTRQ